MLPLVLHGARRRVAARGGAWWWSTAHMIFRGASQGSGDCTEHAVLLAAVVKARGLPARVCHGLVYVEQGGSAISGREVLSAPD